MNFDTLCYDFSRRRPVGNPTGKRYWFTKAWTDGRKSINDLLREFLIDRGIEYLHTFNGDVWFLFDGEWTRCEAEPAGDIVRFYMLEFEMG